jgi:8-oxo-dGTP diphosphatase
VTRIRSTNSAGFPAPIGLAADAVVFTVLDGELAVLLARRQEAPQKGAWSLPGGFVGETESPEQTVARKLEEKTGLGPVYLEQLRTYADPNRDARGWLPAVAYLALIDADLLPEEGPNQASWHPLSALPELVFDHQDMVDDGIERLRGKLWYSNIASGLLPKEFTLAQARNVYEAIAGETYDPGNFTRDMRASGLILPTGKLSQGGQGRPAQMFRFISREPSWSPTRGNR